MKIYFDGGAKPNPGMMECGVIFHGKKIEKYRQIIGEGTNNQAEWIALLWAMDMALSFNLDEADIYGDSQLIINQANGLWKIKQIQFRPFKEEFDILKKRFKRLELHHLLRDKNLAGQFLEFG